MDYAPRYEFQKCVARYRGDYQQKGFSCWDQFLAMAFAQLTYRESLRDIEACLRALGRKRYHMGFRSKVARTTLADANERRDWRIYADFAQVLIGMARPLYAEDPIGVELDQGLYALDSTTIDLCLSLFPWARFRRHKAAVKMHTLLDLHGNIPAFIHVTDGKVHDVNVLDEIAPEAGAFYVMDRAYIDFERLFLFSLCSAFFVVRAKKNIVLRRRYSRRVDTTTGLRSDQTVILTTNKSAKTYPDPLRRISYFDAGTNKRLKFLTNNFALPALTITQIYKSRWQVELFFKWIKQHLRIKSFLDRKPRPRRGNHPLPDRGPAGSLPGNDLPIRQHTGGSDDHTRSRYPDHGRDLWPLRSLSHRVDRVGPRGEASGLFACHHAGRRSRCGLPDSCRLPNGRSVAFRSRPPQVESREGLPGVGRKMTHRKVGTEPPVPTFFMSPLSSLGGRKGFHEQQLNVGDEGHWRLSPVALDAYRAFTRCPAEKTGRRCLSLFFDNNFHKVS